MCLRSRGNWSTHGLTTQPWVQGLVQVMLHIDFTLKETSPDLQLDAETHFMFCSYGKADLWEANFSLFPYLQA